MTNLSPQAKKVDDAYWRAQTNIPDIYTKGRVRFAAGLREVVSQLQYQSFHHIEAFMQLDADDILELIEELEKL
jgi:DNA-directed RNA polymerase subunit F